MLAIPTPSPLTTKAFDILIADIESHRNKPGELQRAALYELLYTLTGYAFKTESGRQAFGLAAGAGKTSAVVAFITALHRLGFDHVAVSVAASKVEALCGIKAKLIANGVPEELIGLKHSHGQTASQPSTGNDDRRFQLVTHARVRGGTDRDLFISHQGQKRAVMIYDETLFRSDTFAVSDFSFAHALAGFGILSKFSGAKYESLLAYLTECGAMIEKGLADAQALLNNEGREVTINLRPLDQITLDGYLAQLSSIPGTEYEALQDLLQISQNPLRIIVTQQRNGVIWFKVSVPEDLKNVVILDASHPIRDLVSLDKTIRTAGSFHDLDVKRFDLVTIYQMLSSGSRTSITDSFRQVNKENRAVSREIVEVIKGNPEAKGILLFTFKKRDTDIAKLLMNDMADAGIDLDKRNADGRKRINLLTWGDECSLNGLEHCDVVIMAGVLHRSYLDLAATIVGQVEDLGAKVDNALTTKMFNSELAHLIYQGASRGSCRTIDKGQAKPMKLYFIHRSLAVKPLLAKVMKGAKWEIWQPVHAGSTPAGIIDLLCFQIEQFLNSLPASENMISTRVLKDRMNLPTLPGKETFTKAIRQVDELSDNWMLDGRSMRRAGSQFKVS